MWPPKSRCRLFANNKNEYQELELSSQLRTEQAKLDDLTDQLNALDKKLQQEQ